MPIDKNGIIYSVNKQKRKLNWAILPSIISFIALFISILTYFKTFTGKLIMSLGYEGYTKTMFNEDIYDELKGRNELCSVSELKFGVQEIYIDFMNTSKTPIYITDFDIYTEIGDEISDVFYKVDKEKTVGNYWIDYKYYVTELYGVQVDDFDDELTYISINPGEFCRIYFLLKINYPDGMLKYMEQYISEGYDMNNRHSFDFEEKQFLYSLVDSVIYNYIIEGQRECKLIVNYKVNGAETKKCKEMDYCIIPICAPEGF